MRKFIINTLKEYQLLKESQEKEYGILYARPVFPKNHPLEWLSHCIITGVLPKVLQTEILNLSNHINLKWKDSIIIPMDNSIAPGCTTKPEVIEEVANDIYQGMLDIFKKLSDDENCVRLVYGVGKLPESHMKTVESTHEIDSFPIMVKIGHFFDYGPVGKKNADGSWNKTTYEPGIFKI